MNNESKNFFKMTLKQLYYDPQTKPIVEPYLRKYIERYDIKRMSHAFRKISWLSTDTIEMVDYDMRTNMGGGRVFFGWYDMVDKLTEFQKNNKSHNQSTLHESSHRDSSRRRSSAPHRSHHKSNNKSNHRSHRRSSVHHRSDRRSSAHHRSNHKSHHNSHR